MISNIVIKITNQLRPILLKIFPVGILKKCKGVMIKKSFNQLKKARVLPYKRGVYQEGINIIGNIKAETGLGQSCRLVAKAVEEVHIPFSILQYNAISNINMKDFVWNEKISDKLPYDINLIHINPHELGLAYMQLKQNVWDYRYNIGYWLWELEEFPEEWTPCFNCVHEIWTPSEYISCAIRKKTSLPVVTIPYYMELECSGKYDRTSFGLPDNKFLFLMMYDHSSIMERKNPIGVLKAFKKAFDVQDDNVGLVIKINNCDKKDINKINELLDGYTNVYLIHEILNRDQVNCLIRCVDVFVSLHRAEGFGLVMAEAMFLETPVIATNWSANTEFMNENVACMVNYKLISIEKDLPPFRAGNRWAEPDLDVAAGYMKKLYEDTSFYKKIQCNAKQHIREALSLDKIKNLIINRIKIIRDR